MMGATTSSGVAPVVPLPIAPKTGLTITPVPIPGAVTPLSLLSPTSVLPGVAPGIPSTVPGQQMTAAQMAHFLSMPNVETGGGGGYVPTGRSGGVLPTGAAQTTAVVAAEPGAYFDPAIVHAGAVDPGAVTTTPAPLDPGMSADPGTGYSFEGAAQFLQSPAVGGVPWWAVISAVVAGGFLLTRGRR